MGAAVVGNAIEFYEFTVYATIAALVFSELFFPASDALTGTLLTFGSFAIGFVSRPLGGLLFGALADRLGRKPVMIWTLWLMGAATFMIGLLPEYSSIGVAAPICLTLLRFMQGFAIGGEWGSAVSLSFEHAPDNRRGLYCSLVQAGSGIGVLLSYITVNALYSWLSHEQVLAWGWRIPFLISAVLIGLGLWARRNVDESPEFNKAERSSPAPRPVRDVIFSHRRGLALATGIHISIAALGFITVFVISYSVTHLQMSQYDVITLLTISSIFYLFAIPVGGLISDACGRLSTFRALSIARIPLPFVFFGLIDSGSIMAYVFALVLLQTLNGLVYGIQASLFSEIFPTAVRGTGISLGFQLATVIGGGLTPLLASILLAMAGGQIWGVALYLTILCIVTLKCVEPLFRNAPASSWP